MRLHPDAGPRPARRRLMRWIVLGATAAAAAGIAVAILASRGRERSPSLTGPVSGSLVQGGDLGELGDAEALRNKVEPALAQGSAKPKAALSREQVQCEAAARALQPGTQILVYVASSRWQGTPAQVLGFSPTTTPAAGRRTPTRIYVMGLQRCRLLSFQSYAP